MDRYVACKRVSVLGIIGNIFLLLIKGFVGFMTMSYAMIADFFNSLGDILSSLMSYIGNKISSKGRDDDHHLGHGKAEYIYSLIISITMMLMSYTVIKDSIISIFKGNSFTYSNWLIIICIVTIITKFLLFLYAHGMYKKYKNILLEASRNDHRNDCFITFGTLISCILSRFNILYIDNIVGIIISLWILYTAIKLFKESYDVLMDKSMSDDIKNKVIDIINKHDEIAKINHFNSTPVGYRYQISFSIFVDGNLSTYESHNIANKLEREIEKDVEEVFQTVIHVNPIEK